MNLQHLHYTSCPSCGAALVAERQENKHTNRHFNETQIFECGATIVWSPNFMSVDESRCIDCSKLRDALIHNKGLYLREVVLDINDEFSSKFQIEFSLRYDSGAWVIIPEFMQDFVLPDKEGEKS